MLKSRFAQALLLICLAIAAINMGLGDYTEGIWGMLAVLSVLVVAAIRDNR
jgi:hypothetical protein